MPQWRPLRFGFLLLSVLSFISGGLSLDIRLIQIVR